MGKFSQQLHRLLNKLSGGWIQPKGRSLSIIRLDYQILIVGECILLRTYHK
jgi:hypothetical protein